MGAVMDDLGARLGTITGLRVFDFPPLSAQAPFGFVNLPESINYDLTYGRGSDRMSVDVYVAVASVVDRAARDALSTFAAGTSVKAALELQPFTVGVYRVTSVDFGPIVLASQAYLGAVFHVDVAA